MKKIVIITAMIITTLGAAVVSNVPVKCPLCNGTGWSGSMKCAHCGGDGDVAN